MRPSPRGRASAQPQIAVVPPRRTGFFWPLKKNYVGSQRANDKDIISHKNYVLAKYANNNVSYVLSFSIIRRLLNCLLTHSQMWPNFGKHEGWSRLAIVQPTFRKNKCEVFLRIVEIRALQTRVNLVDLE